MACAPAARSRAVVCVAPTRPLVLVAHSDSEHTVRPEGRVSGTVRVSVPRNSDQTAVDPGVLGLLHRGVDLIKRAGLGGRR